MDRRDFPSDAAYYRAHGRVFRLALELGVTPIEAERGLALRQAAARSADAARFLDKLRNAPLPRPAWERPSPAAAPPPNYAVSESEEPRVPWWKKD